MIPPYRVGGTYPAPLPLNIGEKKPKRKTDRKALENKLDTLWAKAVKEKFNNRCAICGTDKNLQAAHLWSRRNKTVRWAVENGICLCTRHHLFFAHKEPIAFAKFAQEILGEEVMNELQLKVYRVAHYSIDDLLGIKRGLEAYLEGEHAD